MQTLTVHHRLTAEPTLAAKSPETHTKPESGRSCKVKNYLHSCTMLAVLTTLGHTTAKAVFWDAMVVS